MPTFKIGDKVRVTKKDSTYFASSKENGQVIVGEILEILNLKSLYGSTWDKIIKNGYFIYMGAGGTQVYPLDWVELIGETQSTQTPQDCSCSSFNLLHFGCLCKK